MGMLFRVATLLSRAGAFMAAAVIAAMTLHILLEIFLRAAFSRSTFVLDEFVGYGVAAATFLSLGHTLERQAHIRVTLFSAWLGRRSRAVVEIVCSSIAFLIVLFLCQFFWRGASRNWSRGAVSETLAQVPLWIPEGLIIVGLIILAVQLLAHALRTWREARATINVADKSLGL